jgi:chromosomal replication initiation ATPase DnaA
VKSEIAQLPLALPFRAAQGIEDFLVGPSNVEAVAWIDRWPEWPAHGLVLHGPSGSGKSHLAEVWRAKSGGRMASAENPGPGEGQVVIDNPQLGADETALFHFLNRLKETGGHVLFVAPGPTAGWPFGLADLRSRLAALPAVAIAPPDDALLEGLLQKFFTDRQIRVGADLLRYLVARIERSYDGARRIVAALDAAALAQGRAVTVPLAAQVLASKEET